MLATLLLGYYLGQLYQQHRLGGEGATLVDSPGEIATPARLPLSGHWNLLLAGEPDSRCEQLLRTMVATVNRLAGSPQLQSRIRVRLIATRRPDADSLWNSLPWAAVHYLGPSQRSGLLQVLGLPIPDGIHCGPETPLALVGPDRKLYAHLQLNKPERMAEQLRDLTENLTSMTNTTPNKPGWLDHLNTWLLQVLPQHWLSARMYDLARSETPWLKNTLIRFVSWRFGIDMQEAAIEDRFTYPSFNAFFTRALKPDARPIDATAVVCPADGVLSQAGPIEHGRLIQAKGHDFSLSALLAGDEKAAEAFQSGSFATIYLSPRDYHRVHIPMAGTLREMVFVPGDLFSVSEATTQLVPDLFARNERVILHFDTDSGPLAVILVGAIFVGSMQTVWHGEVKADHIHRWQYPPETAPRFDKGEEIGRFNMGSTVITLHPPETATMRSALIGSHVRMGQAIAD